MYPERIVGIVPNLTTGMFGQRSYDMIVTNYRLIFAMRTKETIRQEHEKAMAGTQNQGLLTKWKTSIAAGFNYQQRYYQMPPEAILREVPDNYEIRPEQVNKVRVIAGHWNEDYGKHDSNKLKIKWSGGKNKFSFESMNSNQVRDMLTPLLGGRVR